MTSGCTEMTAAATPRITPLSVAVVAAFIRVFVGNGLRCCGLLGRRGGDNGDGDGVC